MMINEYNDFDPGEQIDDPDQFRTEHLKWECDNSETLSIAAETLHKFADYLIEMEKAGWQLERPVEDGHLFLINNSVNN